MPRNRSVRRRLTREGKLTAKMLYAETEELIEEAASGLVSEFIDIATDVATALFMSEPASRRRGRKRHRRAG